jgi:hypothetical protein
MTSGATTIDSLFAPLVTVETRSAVWLYEAKQLKPLRLRLGATDGTFTEVLNDSDVPAGAVAVTAMQTGLDQAKAVTPTSQSNPLLGPQRGGRGG